MEINDTILTEAKGGDCYESAFKELMDSDLFGKNTNDDTTMIHAVVTGQGDIDGVQHGHAWIEVGDVVIDQSNGRNIVMRKEDYYRIGKIDPNNSTEFKRYNRKEMAKKATQHKTYGPWDLGNVL